MHEQSMGHIILWLAFGFLIMLVGFIFTSFMLGLNYQNTIKNINTTLTYNHVDDINKYTNDNTKIEVVENNDTEIIYNIRYTPFPGINFINFANQITVKKIE